ncbi:hypothetical protein GWI33_015214 [Rhynchophorus ferrugineus]|uniref:Uncharacterized protein n=1 Tax=Rhynchophorus ferrugineus TaxID=354439 RepID=A0A834M671_RHYFE|nr:hypothetical protein GWI33_015214 [Rhynchophorus ferrugineus]
MNADQFANNELIRLDNGQIDPAELSDFISFCCVEPALFSDALFSVESSQKRLVPPSDDTIETVWKPIGRQQKPHTIYREINDLQARLTTSSMAEPKPNRNELTGIVYFSRICDNERRYVRNYEIVVWSPSIEIRKRRRRVDGNGKVVLSDNGAIRTRPAGYKAKVKIGFRPIRSRTRRKSGSIKYRGG